MVGGGGGGVATTTGGEGGAFAPMKNNHALLRKDHFEQYREIYESKENLLWDIPKNPYESYGEFRNANPLEEGYRIIDEINGILNQFSRHPLQCKMHEAMIKCSAKLIFGSDTVKKYDTVIRKKYGWNNLKQEQMITAPRRFGKTKAVSMFICAFALSKKNCEIAVFSTGSRASGGDTGMMKSISEMLVQLKVPKENIHSKKEHLVIKFGDGDIRRIHAYPASNDTYVSFFSREKTTTTSKFIFHSFLVKVSFTGKFISLFFFLF